MPPDPGPPFPHLRILFGAGRNLSRARRFLARLANPGQIPAGPYHQIGGKGGRGSQGACPLAEYEAAPHARSCALSLRSVHHSKLSTVAFRSSRTPRSTSRLGLPQSCPLVARPASIRILAAFLGAACMIRFFECGALLISATVFCCNRDAKRSQPQEAAHRTNRDFGSSSSQAGSLVLSLPFHYRCLRRRRLLGSSIP